MQTPGPAFARAANPNTDPVADFTFWMLVWALAIDDDRQHRIEQRRKRDQQAQCKPRPPAAPRPF